MDLVIIIVIVAFLPIANYFVIRHEKTWLNPLTIISLMFFVPLVFSLNRLSGLQAKSWDYETYAVIILSLMFWAGLPTIYLLLQKKSIVRTPGLAVENSYVAGKLFANIARCFAISVAAFYFIANYVQTNSLLPFLHPELAYLVHADFPPGIRLIARANPAAVALLFVAYYYMRRRLDLLLMVLLFVLPLTRLSRIDPFISTIVLLVLNSYFPVVRYRAKAIVLLLCVTAVVGLLAIELGNQRTNRFGIYKVKYEDAILWKPEIRGPFSVLPVLYGYFSLSFENFDVFVRGNKLNRTFGLNSFDWLFTGVLKVNVLSSFKDLQGGDFVFKPVSTAATVPTALYPFYADFGAIGSSIPLFIYMLVWLEFYRRASSSPLFAVLFALYSGGFALSTFQAIIVSPLLVQQLFEIAIVFYVVRRLAPKSSATLSST